MWRLDRWGLSVTDLIGMLQELEHLGVGFVSLTEVLDLTTPAGRTRAGLLAVFAEFEREILSRKRARWSGTCRTASASVGRHRRPARKHTCKEVPSSVATAFPMVDHSTSLRLSSRNLKN